MSIVLGIDIGGSTAKAAGYRDGELLGFMEPRAEDRPEPIYSVLEGFLRKHGMPKADVSEIVLTGVGTAGAAERIRGIPAYKADEFEAIARGGLMLSGKEEALVVSIGTGTAFIRADRDGIAHIGGSGVGGGTLMGLSERLFGAKSFEAITEMAKRGDLRNVDLMIEDICGMTSLPPYVTATNFGKIKSAAADPDFALGLINLIFQTVGVMAVFACRGQRVKDVVVTGAMAVLPQAREVFDLLHIMHGITFTIPENAAFAGAVGAILRRQKDLGGSVPKTPAKL